MIYWKIFSVLGAFLLLPARTALSQDIESLLPGLRDKAIVIDITARILENDNEEVWNSKSSKVTIPGKAVSIKLVGANIVVIAQFTPYLRRDGRNILVAQGQIWVDVPHEGMRYQATMQTIPIIFGEEVYFLPLGSSNPNGSVIEILLRLHPYKEEDAPEDAVRVEESSSHSDAGIQRNNEN
ncbi:MAG: hypothetical protein LBK25_09295 [Treponema sp.]|jgi:hypothetical protein|nr:hypothetical protein [Treponema sp.]